MVPYPSPHGVFEPTSGISYDIGTTHGGQVDLTGANYEREVSFAARHYVPMSAI